MPMQSGDRVSLKKVKHIRRADEEQGKQGEAPARSQLQEELDQRPPGKVPQVGPGLHISRGGRAPSPNHLAGPEVPIREGQAQPDR